MGEQGESLTEDPLTDDPPWARSSEEIIYVAVIMKRSTKRRTRRRVHLRALGKGSARAAHPQSRIGACLWTGHPESSDRPTDRDPTFLTVSRNLSLAMGFEKNPSGGGTCFREPRNFSNGSGSPPNPVTAVTTITGMEVNWGFSLRS